MSLILSFLRIVNVLQQGALVDLFTAVADIRRTETALTYFIDKVFAMVVAIRTEFAVAERSAVTLVMSADNLFPAGFSVLAGVMNIPGTAGCNYEHMLTNFTGDRCWILIQQHRYLLKG